MVGPTGSASQDARQQHVADHVLQAAETCHKGVHPLGKIDVVAQRGGTLRVHRQRRQATVGDAWQFGLGKHGFRQKPVDAAQVYLGQQPQPTLKPAVSCQHLRRRGGRYGLGFTMKVRLHRLLNRSRKTGSGLAFCLQPA